MLKHTLNAQTNNKENTSEVQTPSSSASGQAQPQPSQPQQTHYRKTKRAMSEQQQSMSFARQRQLQRPDQLEELPQDEEAVGLQPSYYTHYIVVVSN